MGNTVTRNIDYVTKAYGKFVDKFTSNGTRSREEFRSGFTTFLEDLLTNDEEFESICENVENGNKCIGSLLLYAADINTPSRSASWNLQGICRSWAADVAMRKIITLLIDDEFLICNGVFYRWDGNLWIVCAESDVRLVDIDSKFNRKLKIETFGIENSFVTEGAKWISGKLTEFNNALETFNDDPKLFIDVIRNINVRLNIDDYLPCKNGLVNFSGELIKPERKHRFSLQLSYEFPSQPTKLATTFFEGFNCDKNVLATTVLSWCDFNPIITIILGTGNSGKTALMNVARGILGPFAVRGKGKETEELGIVRTCFYDEDTEILSDAHAVNKHPCPNLVFACIEDPKLGETFGTYNVQYLRLDQIIIPDTHIVKAMTTPEELGGALAWCFKNGFIEKKEEGRSPAYTTHVLQL